MRKYIIKNDPYTGEEFLPKRENQRFSNSANRIKYHNEIANELRKETSQINYPLNKNHKLLRKLMSNKREAEFSFDYLDGYGINFNILNHITKINGISHPSIFEFTLKIDNQNKKVKIINDGRLKNY